MDLKFAHDVSCEFQGSPSASPTSSLSSSSPSRSPTFDDETWDCYKAAVDAVRLSCPRGINDEHVMDHLKILAGICAAEPASDVASTVRSVCA